MKNKILILMLLTVSLMNSQNYDWMSSIDVAKRLALIQNKMLLVMWEDAAIDFELPITVEGNKVEWISVLDYDIVNEELWKYFVPVVLSESLHLDMLKELKETRRVAYISKFNDDSIKIMDANGNIFNTSSFFGENYSAILEAIIERYAINTNYLNKELRDYSTKKNFNTAFRLSSKYLDFAILKNKVLEKGFIALAMIYLDEARSLLMQDSIANKEGFQQKCDLLEWSQHVISNKPRKVLRNLKDIEASNINTINKKFLAFLYYSSYKLLGSETEASLWKNKVSLVDLKKTEMILNKNL